jgi:hypothetical protein
VTNAMLEIPPRALPGHIERVLVLRGIGVDEQDGVRSSSQPAGEVERCLAGATFCVRTARPSGRLGSGMPAAETVEPALPPVSAK